MPPAVITLELQPGEPISGTLRDCDGTVERFRGWLELCAALDLVWQRTCAPSGAAEPSADSARG